MLVNPIATLAPVGRVQTPKKNTDGDHRLSPWVVVVTAEIHQLPSKIPETKQNFATLIRNSPLLLFDQITRIRNSHYERPIGDRLPHTSDQITKQLVHVQPVEFRHGLILAQKVFDPRTEGNTPQGCRIDGANHVLESLRFGAFAVPASAAPPYDVANLNNLKVVACRKIEVYTQERGEV